MWNALSSTQAFRYVAPKPSMAKMIFNQDACLLSLYLKQGHVEMPTGIFMSLLLRVDTQLPSSVRKPEMLLNTL